MRKKLTDRAWYGIFVRYEANKFYKIFYFLSLKIYKTWNVDLDKGLLYNKSDIKPSKLANEEWKNLNNFFFADSLQCDNKKT